MKINIFFLINLIYCSITQISHKNKYIPPSPPINSPNISYQNKKTNENYNNGNQNNIQNINNQIPTSQQQQIININSINIQNNNEQVNNQKDEIQINLTLNDSLNNQQQNNQHQNKESFINNIILILINIVFDFIQGKKIKYIIDEYFADYLVDFIYHLFIKILIFLKNTILFIIKKLNQFLYDIKKYIPYPYDYLLMTFLGYILTDLLISKESYISIKTKPFGELNILIIDKKIKEISNNIEKNLNRYNNNNIKNNNIIFNKNNRNNKIKNQKDNINNNLFINLDNQINNLKNKISSLKNKNEEQIKI